MLSIESTSEDWLEFFLGASVDGLIQNLCVDVHSNGMCFASARTRPSMHLWALAATNKFRTTGEGSFVVKVEDVVKLFKMFRSRDANYLGTVDGDRLKIQNLSDPDEHGSIKLEDLDAHIRKGNKQSSYIHVEDRVRERHGEKRYRLPLFNPPETGHKIPIPKEPSEDPVGKPFKQVIVVTKADLEERLKAAKAVSAETITFITQSEKPNTLGIFIEGSNRLRGHTNIPLKDGDSRSTIDFDQIFDRVYLESMLKTAPNEIYLCMTDVSLGSGNNPGLWLGYVSDGGTGKQTTCCYHLAVMDPRKAQVS